MDADLLKLLENPSVDRYDYIATQLMTEFGIIKTDSLFDNKVVYKFKEIEFYLYDKYNHDIDDRTYDRNTKRGEWFFHNSGVDIAFDSEKEGNEFVKFGGILIRGIEVLVNHDDNWESKWVVGGPKLCMQEIFNNAATYPEIIKLSDQLKSPFGIKKCARYHIDGPSKDEKDRYFDPNVDWTRERPRFQEENIGKGVWKVTMPLCKSTYDAAPKEGDNVNI